MSQHWDPKNFVPAFQSRPTRTQSRQRGSKGLSMGATWVFLAVAMVLFAITFAYLFLLANQPPVCEPHKWLQDVTVCHTEQPQSHTTANNR